MQQVNNKTKNKNISVSSLTNCRAAKKNNKTNKVEEIQSENTPCALTF